MRAAKKLIRRLYRFAVRGATLRGICEVSGVGLLVYAVHLIHPVAGFAAAGLALLNWAYAPRSRR